MNTKHKTEAEEVFDDFTSNHELFDSILTLLKVTGSSCKYEISEIISYLYDKYDKYGDYVGEEVTNIILEEYALEEYLDIFQKKC